jgi:hypothetical protein
METDHILCPNCLKQQIDINLPEESKIKCLDCSKEFIYLKCYHCKKKITMKNLEYIDGTNIQCKYELFIRENFRILRPEKKSLNHTLFDSFRSCLYILIFLVELILTMLVLSVCEFHMKSY